VALLGSLRDSPQWVEILHQLDDFVRVGSWTPGQDASVWAYNSGLKDGVGRAVMLLRGDQNSQE
jgi:hypothetical protein